MTSSDVKEPEAKAFSLEKARLDPLSAQTQMTAAALLSFAVCLAAYFKSLHVGFLLDDFLHLDYVARALRGDWHAFLVNFYGNWAGSDIMKSYRPISSLSIFLDYLFYGTRAGGFHLTNIFLHAGTCLMVGLLTLEITGRMGNRLRATAAVWSALLFAVYPLHAESVTWIIGRVDILCTFFYLCSVFFFMRFQLLQERSYLFLSLGSFLLSVWSKEMAVTLPFVITLAAFLLPLQDDETFKNRLANKQTWMYVACFWIALALVAVARVLMLGTAVGGYGHTDLHSMLSSWRVFADKASLLKTLVPANEELKVAKAAIKATYGAYIAILAVLSIRALKGSCRPAPFIFLLAWTIIAVLPTFQIWHIWPNLVGSRLFFLSSAPLCILLAISALPVVDSLKRLPAMILTAVGATALFALFILWSYLLQKDLSPWLVAGKQMSSLRQELQQIAASTPPGKKVILLDLPTDYEGAGMLTRPDYLRILSKPPFVSRAFASTWLTLTPDISDHDAISQGDLQSLIRRKDIAWIYRWDVEKGMFTPWHPPKGDRSCDFRWPIGALESSNNNFQTIHPGAWQIYQPSLPSLEERGTTARLRPGKNDKLTVWFPDVNLDPIYACGAVIDGQIITGTTYSAEAARDRIRLVWISQAAPSKIWDAPIGKSSEGLLTSFPGRYKAWCLNGPVKHIGLTLSPGDYALDIRRFFIRPLIKQGS